jgi:hypothetical protein
MAERRTLIALLLLAATAALFLIGRRSGTSSDPKNSPDAAEAAERAKADPFPAPGPQP